MFSQIFSVLIIKQFYRIIGQDVKSGNDKNLPKFGSFLVETLIN